MFLVIKLNNTTMQIVKFLIVIENDSVQFQIKQKDWILTLCMEREYDKTFNKRKICGIH